MQLSIPWCVVFVLCLTLTNAASGQEKPVPLKRGLRAVQHRSAGDLAKMLNPQFKGDAAVAIVADAPSNCLLVRAPAATFEQLMAQLDELDRAPRGVIIDVWVAELKPETVKDRPKNPEDWGMTGPAAEVAQKLEALRKKDVVGAVSHAQLNALEHRPVMLMSGQERAFVAAVLGGAAGRVSKSIQFRATGTLTTATARVLGELIRLDVVFEDSRPRLRTEDQPLGIDADGAAIHATEFITSRVDAQVGIPAGQAILLANLKTQAMPLTRMPRGEKQVAEPRPDHVLVIVGARLADAPLAAAKDK